VSKRVKIKLKLGVAQDVYDELYARMEQIDSFDPTRQRKRTSKSLWKAIQALRAAGVGPRPLEDQA
jgi:hypothetical protein